VLEPALVRQPTKKHLELQLSKDNALKVVRANPGLGQGNGLPCPPWRELLGGTPNDLLLMFQITRSGPGVRLAGAHSGISHILEWVDKWL